MTVQTLAIVVLLVSFFVMIFLRFPIAYAVGLSSVFCMLVQGQALTDVCRLMVKGISSFSLMAVPFFITMGVLMGSGGISEKLIALADACVGWMRGGMAMVNIVASYFFGGISGSASADTASIGSIMIPMMVNQGYDADFSTAVTITSSCEGLLVPPSHNMVIYATTAGGISVGSLFLAGYLPGALLAMVLMVGSYIISVKENYPKGSPFSIKGFIKQMGTSVWALAAVGVASIVRHCGDRHGVDEWHPIAGQRPQRRRKCPFTGQRPGGAPFAAALHAGDMQTAEAFRVRFEVRASSYPYPAEVQSERELIERFAQ